MSQAKYGALADSYARKYGVDPALYRRLITAESGWNPNAVSGAGARGLTQVVPKWHPGANLSTPAGQLDYGAKHLGSLMKKYGNPRDALAVYNSGKPWAVSQSYGETNRYVTKILSGYQPGQSGGRTSPDAGAAPPTAPASIPQGVQIDAKRLYGLLNDTKARVLRGEMPGPNYSAELQKIIAQAAPRAEIARSAQGVGAQVAGSAANVVGAVADRSSAQVINAAKGALGIPYSWGGGTPSGPTKGFGRGANTVGFDCSSLVQMAWAKAGVQLPRTTYGQIKAGQAVNASNPNQWKAGDLLFPSTGHVQMYLGNGKVIEAPRTGGKVQIVGLRPKYIAVRRPA